MIQQITKDNETVTPVSREIERLRRSNIKTIDYERN